MDDSRSRHRACGTGSWVAPAIDCLKIAATANSSGYNADFKGLHLNAGPRGVSPAPPAETTRPQTAAAGAAVTATAGDRRGWQAPVVARFAIGREK